VFPEKEAEPGSIYIEAVDKVSLKKIRDITFVNANDVLGIIYTSKSGHSKLKWRQVQGPMGRISGDASNNSLVNLSMARIITPEYVEELVNREGGGEGGLGGDARQEAAAAVEDSEMGPLEPPNAGEPALTPEEEAQGFGAADPDEGEQEDLAQQQREETV
jgi:hypothetical protein